MCAGYRIRESVITDPKVKCIYVYDTTAPNSSPKYDRRDERIAILKNRIINVAALMYALRCVLQPIPCFTEVITFEQSLSWLIKLMRDMISENLTISLNPKLPPFAASPWQRKGKTIPVTLDGSRRSLTKAKFVRRLGFNYLES
jgi:hypothetical protein